MTEPEIYDLLNQIFRQLREDDSIVLTPATTAEDVDAWDSMNHIFIVEEEKRFGVKFQAAEMAELKTWVSWPRCLPKSWRNRTSRVGQVT